MVRVVKFNKTKFGNELDKYTSDKKLYINEVAKKAKITEPTIHRMISRGTAFLSTIRKLEKIGLPMDKIDLKNVK